MGIFFYYDNELEKENITQEINEVVVFTKIPKNSIKIPVAGGKSYSPDFAYVINFIEFRTQFSRDKIVDLIRELI